MSYTTRHRGFHAAGALVVMLDSTEAVSPEADKIRERLRHQSEAVLSSAWALSLSPERRFSDLAQQWRSDVAFTSSATDMFLNSAYQQIIGMGSDVVPIILRDLQRTPDHWFWALGAITGVNPVPKGDRGNIDSMAKHWIEWGRKVGLLA